jgi:hypothetical protein
MPYLKPREPGEGDAWSAEAAAQDRRGSQRIVHAGEVPAPVEVARLLGTPDGEQVVVRRRLILLDDEPNELTDTYYPVAVARGTPLAATAKIRGEAVTLLAELGHIGALVREAPAPAVALRDQSRMTVAKTEPEAHDRRSLHERIAADLRNDIMTGELPPGANLPPSPRSSKPASTPPTPRSRRPSNSSRTSAWWSDARERRCRSASTGSGRFACQVTPVRSPHVVVCAP